MTANEIYTTALSLLPSNAGEDDTLKQYVVGWINLAMRETLPVENSVRESEGRGILSQAPVIVEGNEEIPYCDGLTGYAFPYFLASLMCKDDDDSYWAQDYRGRYIVAVRETERLLCESVRDVYGKEES